MRAGNYFMDSSHFTGTALFIISLSLLSASFLCPRPFFYTASCLLCSRFPRNFQKDFYHERRKNKSRNELLVFIPIKQNVSKTKKSIL